MLFSLEILATKYVGFDKSVFLQWKLTENSPSHSFSWTSQVNLHEVPQDHPLQERLLQPLLENRNKEELSLAQRG